MQEFNSEDLALIIAKRILAETDQYKKQLRIRFEEELRESQKQSGAFEEVVALLAKEREKSKLLTDALHATENENLKLKEELRTKNAFLKSSDASESRYYFKPAPEILKVAPIRAVSDEVDFLQQLKAKIEVEKKITVQHRLALEEKKLKARESEMVSELEPEQNTRDGFLR